MSAGLLRTLAAVFACVAVLLAIAGWKLGQDSRSVPAPSSTVYEAPASTNGIQVLVATQDIFPGDDISSANTSIASYSAPIQGSFQSLESLPGLRVVRPVQRGKVFTVEDFEQEPKLAHALSPGKRGVAVSVDELIAVGGHIKPGDKVDVLFSAASPNDDNSYGARKIFSGLTLLSVGSKFAGEPEQPVNPQDERSRSSQNSAANARTVVLEIDESLAPALLLAENTGRLRLALMGAEESRTVVHNAMSLSELEELLGPFVYLNNLVYDEEYEQSVAAAEKEAAEATTVRQVQLHVGGQTSTVQFPVTR